MEFSLSFIRLMIEPCSWPAPTCLDTSSSVGGAKYIAM